MNIKQVKHPNGTRSYLEGLLARTDIEVVMGLLDQGGAPPFELKGGMSKPVTAAFVKYAERVLGNIENPFAKHLLKNGIQMWKSELR